MKAYFSRRKSVHELQLNLRYSRIIYESDLVAGLMIKFMESYFAT